MSYANQVSFLPNPNWAGYSAPSMICTFGNCYGHGVPSNNDGFDGNTYIDLDSVSDFYAKANGVWGIASGGGGGGAGLTYYQGAGLDPNGVQSGSVGDVYHSRVSLGGDGTTWWKVSGTASTSVWE